MTTELEIWAGLVKRQFRHLNQFQHLGSFVYSEWSGQFWLIWLLSPVETLMVLLNFSGIVVTFDSFFIQDALGMITELEIWPGLVSSVCVTTWPLWTFTGKPVSTVRPICSFWMVWPLLCLFGH